VVSLASDLRQFQAESARLLALLASTTGILPEHRKVIAEITLVRLSILLENALKNICSKICVGAPYLDGSSPILYVPQPTITTAIAAMKTLGRGGRVHQLKWNDGAEIRDNIGYIVDKVDDCVIVLKNHASFLAEVRSVRNHITHRNDGTRKNFKNVLVKHYGAFARNVTCGMLLLSPRPANSPLIDAYIKTSRVLIKDLVKG
jgi:hypothetical protein